MKQRAARVCIAGACGLVACRGSEPPASASPPTPASTVVLRDAGAEPRRALAYRPHDGDESFKVEISPPDQPAQTTVQLRWSFAGQSAAGTRYRFAITDATFSTFLATGRVDGQDGEFKARIVSNNDGVTVADEHGRLSAELPGTMHTVPSAYALLETFVVPLPSEPIGVGARWHVERPSLVLGGKVGIDYELAALTADSARVRWTMRSLTPPPGDHDGHVEQQGSATIGFEDFVPRVAEILEVTRFPSFPEWPAIPPVVSALVR